MSEQGVHGVGGDTRLIVVSEDDGEALMVHDHLLDHDAGVTSVEVSQAVAGGPAVEQLVHLAELAAPARPAARPCAGESRCRGSAPGARALDRLGPLSADRRSPDPPPLTRRRAQAWRKLTQIFLRSAGAIASPVRPQTFSETLLQLDPVLRWPHCRHTPNSRMPQPC